jgi:cysteine desulfurase
MTRRVYLDWNATAPLRPEAAQAMAAALQAGGNPSSVHAEGRAARHTIEAARRDVARAVGATADQVTFTSGGTEANALALAAAPSDGRRIERLLVSSIEHPSVLAGGRWPADRIKHVGVSPQGVIELGELRALLADGTPSLVSVMLANNETGALQPVREIANLAREAHALLHADAIQAFGKIEIDFNSLGADLLSLSGHKIGAAAGIGALIAAPGVEARPELRGGGQEFGRRAGTENLAGAAAFGAAARAVIANLPEEIIHMAGLRQRLEAGLRRVRGVTIFADEVPRLPNTTLFTAPNMQAETALIGFDLAGIAVSSGSACSSGKVQPSHVLKAMGCTDEAARGAIRVSLGWSTTAEDVDYALEAWRNLAGALTNRDETVLERF